MNERRNNYNHNIGALAAIAAPIRGMGRNRKLERDKYRIELDRLRAEMKDKLAGGQEPRTGERAKGCGHTNGKYRSAAPKQK